MNGRGRHFSRLFGLVVMAPAMLFAGPHHEPGGDASLAELAARFRAYRVELRRDTAREHAELRDWDGPVHRVMADVGHRIEGGRYRVTQVYRLIGRPDKVVRGGDRHGGMAVPRDESHLVYWWRGGHDYLYLIVRRGRVVGSRWWYAGE